MTVSLPPLASEGASTTRAVLSPVLAPRAFDLPPKGGDCCEGYEDQDHCHPRHEEGVAKYGQVCQFV